MPRKTITKNLECFSFILSPIAQMAIKRRADDHVTSVKKEREAPIVSNAGMPWFVVVQNGICEMD